MIRLISIFLCLITVTQAAEWHHPTNTLPTMDRLIAVRELDLWQHYYLTHPHRDTNSAICRTNAEVKLQWRAITNGLSATNFALTVSKWRRAKP